MMLTREIPQHLGVTVFKNSETPKNAQKLLHSVFGETAYLVMKNSLLHCHPLQCNPYLFEQQPKTTQDGKWQNKHNKLIHTVLLAGTLLQRNSNALTSPSSRLIAFISFNKPMTINTYFCTPNWCKKNEGPNDWRQVSLAPSRQVCGPRTCLRFQTGFQVSPRVDGLFRRVWRSTPVAVGKDLILGYFGGGSVLRMVGF